MKKNILFVIMIFLGALCPGQNPHLYWRFANPAVYSEGSDLFLDFDIELSCDISGTYHCDIQSYLLYNSVAFGPEIIQTGNFELNKLNLIQGDWAGTPIYNLLPRGKLGTDTRQDMVSLFAHIDIILTIFSLHQIPLLPEWDGFMNIKMKVFDPTQNAGIEFLHNDGNYRLMDGGQYYLDVTHPIPTKYGDPPNYECIFMNDLLDFPLTNTTLDLKVLLEGPYDPATNKMGTDIVSNSLFPPDQPFQPPLPYYGNMNPVWYYAGTEAVATAPQDAVDWILLELRDAPDAAAATPATTVGKMAAVLLKDGSVVTTDGFSMPVFPVAIAQGLFTVIYHRNHLPVMNAIPLQAVNGLYTCNFTTGPDKVYGGATGYSELEPGVWGLASSDGNADGQSSNNDKNDVWILQAGSSGYLPGDFNLDTQVNNTDKNECWILNSGMGSQVPD